jgi:hypothetical protein
VLQEDECFLIVIFLDGCRFWNVRALADGRALVSGPQTQFLDRGGEEDFLTRWAIARVTSAGALDPAWDGDGIKLLEFPPSDLVALFYGVGQSALQDDGKVLVPYITAAGESDPKAPRVSLPDGPGVHYGVQRLNVTQPEQPAPAAVTPAQAATPVVAPAPVVLQSRSCTSRRSFRIRLRTGRRRAERSPIVSTRITVNGRRVSPRRNGATVNLRNLPRGRFTVVISLRLKDGGRVRDVRRYRTCARKIARELPGLRTRAPRKRR